MAEPPEEPPGGPFGEPPEEPSDEPDGRFRQPLEEPPDELYGGPPQAPGGFGEPPEDRYDEPRAEPPAEPPGGFGEPPEDRYDEPRAEPPAEPPGGYGEPPQDRYDEPPAEPPGGFGEPPWDRHDEPPREPSEDRYDEPPPEPPVRRFPEPPRFAAPPQEPPEAPTGRFGGARQGRFGRWSREPENGEEGAAGPTGERYEPPDQPTGELFDDGPPDELPVSPPGDLIGDLGQEVHSRAELAQRRARERAQHRRAGRQRLFVLIAGLVVVVVIIVLVTSGGSGTQTPGKAISDPLTVAGTGVGYLAAGSTASALPGNILVADRNNNRLIVISPQGRLLAWKKSIAGPADAFLSPTGKSIIVTETGAFIVKQLGVSDRIVFYHYGHSGQPGSANDRLHDPQTAQELSDGTLVIADKSNCRVVFIKPPKHHPSRTFGTPGSCLHDPPDDLGYPDAVFPASNGTGLVVTEFDPAWVDVLGGSGAVINEVRVSGLSAPDDAHEYAAGDLIATSHSHPGAVEEFTTAGKVLWRYGPTSGPGELDRPSLAEVLPGGDVLVCDSDNDRIVVIDPQKKIVWQYGHTRQAGSKPGYLHTPDSAILVTTAS